MDIDKIRISEIKESPYQGRMISSLTKKGVTIDQSLRELEVSIGSQGLVTPVIVRPVEGGYELIDGHRRVEVFKKLNEEYIPAVIKAVDDEKAQAYSIIGNLHRKNLSAIEKAIAFRKIMDSGVFKTVKDFSIAIGKHETFVGDLMNTLEMDQRIIDDLVANKSTDDVRLLRAIRKVEKAKDNFSEKQWELYQEFLVNQLTREQLIKLVKSKNQPQVDTTSVRIQKTARNVSFRIKQVPAEHIDQIQRMIEEYIGKIES